MTSGETTQQLIAVLHQLDEMAEENIVRMQEVQDRVAHLLGRLNAGERLSAIVQHEPQLLIPQLLTKNLEALGEVGSMLRKAEAAALRADGYTLEQIANLFGVTRQRVSALLKG